MSNLFNMDKKLEAFKEMRKSIPTQIGNEARNFFLASFRNQGFTNAKLTKWKEVQRRTEGTKAYKYPKKKKLGRRTKAINVNTGRLRRSITVVDKSINRIKIASVGVSYAQYVNADREFMGDSKTLRKKIKKKYISEINKILKPKKK